MKRKSDRKKAQLINQWIKKRRKKAISSIDTFRNRKRGINQDWNPKSYLPNAILSFTMTDLQENLRWIIGSAVAGIVAFLSWFYQSGLLSTLIGIAMGAGITYFVQTRTQKRVWKREYALRIAETVYGPLFQDVDVSLRYHGDKSVPSHIVFDGWTKIKNTYQYLMVDDDFGNRLERLSEKASNFTERLQKMWSLTQDIAVEKTGNYFPSFRESEPRLVIKTETGEQHYTVSESLIMREHPYTSALKKKGEHKKQECVIVLIPVKGGPSQTLTYDGSTKTIFDAMWEDCHQRFEQDPEVQAIRKEYPEIIEEMWNIRKELARRIKEPWKI